MDEHEPPIGTKLDASLLGDDFFDTVVAAGFDKDSASIQFDTLQTFPRLSRYRHLSKEDLQAFANLDRLQVLDLFGCDITNSDYKRLAKASQLHNTCRPRHR